ncbi:hypothetical protein DYB35_009716 [Aphanomyces astaci]|uniref:Integrase SAM-like N-terminal domain-containing protein n=1 Tax=Aphanomyces astaci TaxID=112090 RepID=A0A3R7A6S8_APHAT|nr:hypothetical protein DYB35_009716 [Aphanomyces astaci]
MPPKGSAAPASKQTIEESFHGTSTRRAYDTYQQQFEAFLQAHKTGTALEAASTEDCTDFFHALYTRGLTARTIDVDKSALVAYFNSKRVSPNPAQDSIARQYIIGLQTRRTIGRYLSVRLRWHKKANVEEDCQIYHLIDETSYPCLRLCTFHDEYLATLRASGSNVASSVFVFPKFTIQQGGVPRVDWYRALKQSTLRKLICEIVNATPNLPIGISLHSLRRGGAFYRVFESNERRFNFRELMAWCRWADAKKCCEYLVTQSLSNEMDPRNLLRTGATLQRMQWTGTEVAGGASGSLPFSVDELGEAVAKRLQQSSGRKFVVEPKSTKQLSMDGFGAQKTIPTARLQHRKKYSERLTLAFAFEKYQSYEQFEAAYSGFTKSYARLLREVRNRKRLGTL